MKAYCRPYSVQFYACSRIFFTITITHHNDQNCNNSQMPLKLLANGSIREKNFYRIPSAEQSSPQSTPTTISMLNKQFDRSQEVKENSPLRRDKTTKRVKAVPASPKIILQKLLHHVSDNEEVAVYCRETSSVANVSEYQTCSFLWLKFYLVYYRNIYIFIVSNRC